jgi:hypothetical protein
VVLEERLGVGAGPAGGGHEGFYFRAAPRESLLLRPEAGRPKLLFPILSSAEVVMAELMLRPLGVGEIIDHSLAIYRRQFGALLTITLAANAVPLVLMVYLMTSGGILDRPGLYFGILLLSVVLGALATAATVFLVSETYLGNSISGGQAFSRATRFTGRLILLTMMLSLVVGLSALLFLVPGMVSGSPVLIALGFLPAVVTALVIFTGLLVSAPALVLEDLASSAALNRSWHLTKGFRWKMLGLVVVVAIIIAIPAMAITFLRGGGMSMQPSLELTTGDIMWEIAGQLISTLIYPLLYCALTIAYYDLRVRKEGFDLELLESTLAHVLPSDRSPDIRDLPDPRHSR